MSDYGLVNFFSENLIVTSNKYHMHIKQNSVLTSAAIVVGVFVVVIFFTKL